MPVDDAGGRAAPRSVCNVVSLRNGTWLVRWRVFPVVPEREVAGGSGQQRLDVRERWSTGGAQEAVVPDCDEALWQAMLEEASDAFVCGKRAALPLGAWTLLAAEGGG